MVGTHWTRGTKPEWFGLYRKAQECCALSTEHHNGFALPHEVPLTWPQHLWMWRTFFKCSSCTRVGPDTGVVSAHSAHSHLPSWLCVLLQHGQCHLAVVPAALSNTTWMHLPYTSGYSSRTSLCCTAINAYGWGLIYVFLSFWLKSVLCDWQVKFPSKLFFLNNESRFP